MLGTPNNFQKAAYIPNMIEDLNIFIVLGTNF